MASASACTGISRLANVARETVDAARYDCDVWRRRLAVASLCAAALAGCGGSPSAGRTLSYTYGPLPSVSARMICRHETIQDFADVLGVRTVTAPTATWHGHRYTCTYRYRNGTMVLYVQALPTLADTIAYMKSLGVAQGDVGAVPRTGQGSFTTTNGSVVSRKDNKVLVVDVARLPAQFGHPATSRHDVALTVTDIIFACWRGD